MNDVSPASAPARSAPRTHGDERRQALAAELGRVEAALEAAVEAQSPLVARLRLLRRRLAHDHLQLAVLGQFKRGKSTFINALLGAAVLPTGVIPLTASATFIAFRPSPLIVVRFKDGARSQEFSPQTAEEIRNVLFGFVAEEGNPENRLGVARVDLHYPADLLADGTVIIDTPGVGSTLQHNTEAALQVLPECDAAFFVVSADPPITDVELQYLRRLKSKTARIFFVLNKADYLNEDDRRRIVEFLLRVLAEKSLLDADARIFCISARDALAAKQSGDRQAVEKSGIAELEEHVVATLASEKSRWLEEAVRSKAADILSQASSELSLRLSALTMPIEELAAKSEDFQQALRSIEEERRIAGDLLGGEHRRLRDALESRVEFLRKEIAVKLAATVDSGLAGAAPAAEEETARHALSTAVQAAFEAAREPLVSGFAVDTVAALSGCQRRVDALVDRVRQAAANIFKLSFWPDVVHEGFELGEDPYWVTESTRLSLIPDPSRLVDRLLPAPLRRGRLRARLIRQADNLIVRNSENLRWAILRGLDETFRKATARFEERLDETMAATRDVIRDTLDRRRNQSFAIRPEFERLTAAAGALVSLRERVEGDGSKQRVASGQLQANPERPRT